MCGDNDKCMLFGEDYLALKALGDSACAVVAGN